ncbi:MAG: hypothetical protein K1X47_02480 [Cyclobacteriaceae bacterium]|nr:hypothetical protein [Cyclobacteriaceae bacterium]
MTVKTLSGLLLGALVLGSCSFNSGDYDVKGVEATPTVAVPLAFGSLSVQDLLNEADSTYIKVKPDGLVFINYDQELATQSIHDLIDIPNIANLTTVLNVPGGNYPPSSSDVTSTAVSRVVDMGINPEQLTEISFTGGLLNYNMNLSPSNPNFLFAVQISIPEFQSKTTGQGLLQTVSNTGTIDLSGYVFKSAAPNKFNLTLTLIIRKNTNSVNVANGSQLSVGLSFTGMKFGYIKGFFGDQVANPAAQTLDIGAFGTSLLNGATVSFAAPVVSLNVVNDYGVPLQVVFNKLEARKPGSVLPMQTTPASPITVNSPAQLGQSATTSVTVNNVNALLDFAPTQFYYDVTGHINAGLSSGTNFMADTSKMHVNLHVEVPLYGKASGIVLADTVAIDLGSIDQSKVETAALKTLVNNQLPLNVAVQVYLTDANYVLLDSLLTPAQSSIIPASTVNASGELQSAGQSDQLIQLDKDKVAKLFTAKYVIVKGRLSTSKDAGGNQVNVKFLTSYKLDVKLGLQAGLKAVVDF